MNIQEAKQKAAQCWCHPAISGTKLDPVLAEVFAELLVRESKEIHDAISYEKRTRQTKEDDTQKVSSA